MVSLTGSRVQLLVYEASNEGTTSYEGQVSFEMMLFLPFD